jgi:hypothetical protein
MNSITIEKIRRYVGCALSKEEEILVFQNTFPSIICNAILI